MDQQENDVAVITGATSGIGRWIALGLVRANFHVVAICRNVDRSSALVAWLKAKEPEARVSIKLADLRSIKATYDIALAIRGEFPQIKILANNAGMFSAKHERTSEGFDSVLALNHLATHVMSHTLLPALVAAAPSRIVNTGSSTSDRARIDTANLELNRGWGMVRAYSQSKLAMMMSTFVMARRLEGTGVVANVVHPGTVATGLIRERGAIGFAWRLMAPFLSTDEQGAASPLHAALSAEWATTTGAYMKDRRAVAPNRRANDATLTEKVDTETRRLIQSVIPDYCNHGRD